MCKLRMATDVLESAKSVKITWFCKGYTVGRVSNTETARIEIANPFVFNAARFGGSIATTVGGRAMRQTT